MSLFLACSPAPLCWTPCCSNQQNLRTPQFRTHCSTRLLTPSAGVWVLVILKDLVVSICHLLSIFSFVVKALWKGDTSWSSASSCRIMATATRSPQTRRVRLTWSFEMAGKKNSLVLFVVKVCGSGTIWGTLYNKHIFITDIDKDGCHVPCASNAIWCLSRNDCTIMCQDWVPNRANCSWGSNVHLYVSVALYNIK